MRLTEQGQITERFTHAIDQLGAVNADGSKNLELRLGGIYTLERIARVSEELHLSVMEVLSAYVREHAPKKPHDKTRKDNPSPDPDIAAILTAIGRRSRDSKHGDLKSVLPRLTKGFLTPEGTPKWDISADVLKTAREVAEGVNLREIDPKGMPWAFNLVGTDLRGASCYEAYFYGGEFDEADLERADLEGADLRAAWLHQANLKKANLRKADLRNATLTKAILKGAVLEKADLRLADLEGADLEAPRIGG